MIQSMAQKTKLVTKLLIIFGLVVFVVSCLTPATKESYLGKFENFVERVEQNHKSYNKKDWLWADSQFEKYSKIWYSKFKGEYTIKDQLKIKSLILEYNSLKDDKDFGEALRELFNDDVKDIHEKIEEYIEKEMDEDLEKLFEGAEEIGDSAVKVLEDTIDKIERKL